MESKQHPQTIDAIYRGQETPQTLVAVNIDGEIYPPETVTQDDGKLMYNGVQYKYAGITGQRQIFGLVWEWTMRYRLMTGWRCLADYIVEGGEVQMLPLGQHPTTDRAQAERDGLHTAHLYIANGYHPTIQVHLVYQDGDTFSEPVATFDGSRHTRAEAIQHVMDGTSMTWDWVQGDDEAGDGDASPAPDAAPTQEDRSPEHTTDPAPAQLALVVRYKGTGVTVLPTGKNVATGELVHWQDAAGNDIAGYAQSVYESRMWLRQNGYEPDFPKWRWLDRGHGPRRRVEVYQQTGEVVENVDYGYLSQQARANRAPEDGPVTQEMRDKWIAAAREKKRAAGLDPDLPITLQIENYGCDPAPTGRDHAFNYGHRLR